MKNVHRHVATLPWQPIFFLKESPLVYFQKIWKSQNCLFWRYALLILNRRYFCYKGSFRYIFCKEKEVVAYCCFVDYTSAFDTIWHAGMYIKLIKEGVTGKILNVAYQLYQNVKSCVELNGKKSDYFCCNIGVRQGDSLSQLLFAIFVNDLESYLLQEGNNYLSFGGDARLENMLKLLIFMYADDTVILADPPYKLQAAINGMEKYCEKWKLKVNVSKTKIIIFGSRKHLDRVYLYNKKQIEIVDYFKYLGVHFTPNGKFTECRKYVVNQARKAMYLILKKARIQKPPIDVQLDLFHSMVLPILLYSSEVWGIENNDLIIKLHVKFWKTHPTL